MITEQLTAGGFFDDRRNILSLDIFDTAVTRRLASPTHVFAVVEQRLGETYGEKTAAGFAAARIKAERAARIPAWTAGREEVTLDEIYASLKVLAPGLAGCLGEARVWEIEAELACIEPVPEILAVYQEVKTAGHQVIFVSDMYLPLTVIKKMLSNSGYSKDDKIYLSSELRRTKATGHIWETVTADLDCKPGQITHVGDNEHSDVLKAGEHGIRAILQPSWSDEHKRYAGFSKAILPLSKLITHARKSGGEYVGNCYLPVLFGAYVQWVHERARALGIKKVFFLSRDGHILKRTWELLREKGVLSPEIQVSYLEASRKVLVLASITELNESAMQFLRGGQEKNRPVEVYVRRVGIALTDKVEKKILRHFQSTDALIEHGYASEPLRQLLLNLEPELLAACQALRQRAVKYLEQVGLLHGEKKKIIVDLGWMGNMQSALVRLCDLHSPRAVELSGLYAGLLKLAQQNRYRAGYMEGMIVSDFEPWGTYKTIEAMVPLLELLHGAPHGSVTDYDLVGGAVEVRHGDNEFELRQHDEIVAELQNAALKKLALLCEKDNETGVAINDLTPEAYKESLHDLVMYPTQSDLATLGGLYHVDGFEHAGRGIPLITQNDGLPSTKDEAIKWLADTNHFWVAGTLKHWQCRAKDTGATIPWLREVARHYASFGEEWISTYST